MTAKAEIGPDDPYTIPDDIWPDDESSKAAAQRIRDKLNQLRPPAEQRRATGAVCPADSRMIERARAYARVVDPSVQGQDGSGRAFRAACRMLDFGLSESQAVDILLDEFNPRCQPPWSVREITHKVADAAKVARSPIESFSQTPSEQIEVAMTPQEAANLGMLASISPVHEPPVIPPVGQVVPMAPITLSKAEVAESVDDPHRLARTFLKEEFGHPERVTLAYWRQQWYRWGEGYWREVSAEAVRLNLADHMKREYDRELRSIQKEEGKSREQSRTCRHVVAGSVTNALNALMGLSRIPEEISVPAWLGDATSCPYEDVREVASVRNGTVALNQLSEQNPRYFREPSPRWFNVAAAEFDFAESDDPPTNFLQFLRDCFAGESTDGADQILLVQLWFGYLLTSQTRHQKALYLIGPPRSGKGTLLTVMQHLVGLDNAFSGKMSTFADDFGTEALIGKPVAIFPDVRFDSHSPESASLLESILSITGEDIQSIRRKYRSNWRGRLTCRIVLGSNDLISFSDPTGAFSSRFLFLRFTNSFLGKEDFGLMDRLVTEMPKIFVWACQGYHRLRKLGRFPTTVATQEIGQEMREKSNPVISFVEEECELDPLHRIPVMELYGRYEDWAKENGHKLPAQTTFSRWLRSAYPAIQVDREGSSARSRVRYYAGIRCIPAYE